MKNRKVFSIESLRLIPFISAMMMMLHCIFLLLGVNECITEMILITGGFLIARNFSIALGYCGIHRLLIYYSYAMMACIWWQREGPGFGNYLISMRMFMIAIGCLLFTLLFMSHLENEKR